MTQPDERLARELLATEFGDHPQWSEMRRRILTGSTEIHSDVDSLVCSMAVRAIIAALKSSALTDHERLTRELLSHLRRIPMTEWVWADALMIFEALEACAQPTALAEREAVKRFLGGCAEEIDKQQAGMLAGGHKTAARDCKTEAKAYRNAIFMLECGYHVSPPADHLPQRDGEAEDG